MVEKLRVGGESGAVSYTLTGLLIEDCGREESMLPTAQPPHWGNDYL